jgi:TPR repeat protein
MGRDMADVPTEAGKLNVFVSYSRADFEFADQLVAALELAGYKLAIDRSDIHGAEAWKEKLAALIGEADTVVFLLSPSSAQSKTCAWEVQQAVALNKRIIPVAVSPLHGTPAPPPLEKLNYIFFYNEPDKPGTSWASGLRELDVALKTDVGWLREHTRLLQRALEWEKGGHFEGRLLSGQDILDAKAWVSGQPANAPAPTELHLAFIQASEDREQTLKSERERQLLERERLVSEAEAARTAREAAQAEALAAARLTARRTRTGLVAVTVLLVAVAVAAGWAWQLRREAEAQRMLAIAEKTRAEERATAAQEAEQIVQALFATSIGSSLATGTRVLKTNEMRDRDLFQRVKRLASHGNKAAHVILAQLYFNGKGTQQDFLAAKAAYEQAVAAGVRQAMSDLGLIAYHGLTGPRDFAEARKWFEKAAEAGEVAAMNNLGTMYLNGEGVPRDPAIAREWFEKAAGAGALISMRALGLLYATGEGVDRDFAKAKAWLEKAASWGDAGSMNVLGALYLDGIGIAPDYKKAREWIEKAAAEGEIEAWANLGLLYKTGRGVERDLLKAREWYEKAAGAGETAAMVLLANFLSTPQSGILDLEGARKWYEKASANTSLSPADQGNLSWVALKLGKPADALAAAERALAADPAMLPADTNRIQALMFLGRADEARTAFISRNAKRAERETKPFAEVIAQDFAELRLVGQEHPQMAEIEALLGVAKR